MNKMHLRIVASLLTLALGSTARAYEINEIKGDRFPAQKLSFLDVPTRVMTGIFVDAQDFPLYTFDRDQAWQASNCNGGCATTWPPLIVADNICSCVRFEGKTVTCITRVDGTRQLAFDGKPLYRYSGDTRPQDILGDGLGGVWHKVGF